MRQASKFGQHSCDTNDEGWKEFDWLNDEWNHESSLTGTVRELSFVIGDTDDRPSVLHTYLPPTLPTYYRRHARLVRRSDMWPSNEPFFWKKTRTTKYNTTPRFMKEWMNEWAGRNIQRSLKKPIHPIHSREFCHHAKIIISTIEIGIVQRELHKKPSAEPIQKILQNHHNIHSSCWTFLLESSADVK